MLGVKTPMYIGVKKFAARPASFAPSRGEKLNKSENRWINIVPGNICNRSSLSLNMFWLCWQNQKLCLSVSEFADDFDVFNSQVIFWYNQTMKPFPGTIFHLTCYIYLLFFLSVLYFTINSSTLSTSCSLPVFTASSASTKSSSACSSSSTL